jgi:hypothetical protein
MITNRQTIADALDAMPAVEGPQGEPVRVHGHAKKPIAPATGDAWPLVDALERGPGQAFQTRWRIAVVLGADAETASDMLDTLVPAACDALVEVVYVDSARPLLIPTEAGNLFGCELIARSE